VVDFVPELEQQGVVIVTVLVVVVVTVVSVVVVVCGRFPSRSSSLALMAD